MAAVGDDVLRGGGDADLLGDSAGADVMTGGNGADVFLVVTDSSKDVVTDYRDGVDMILLESAEFASLTITDLTPGKVRIEHAGDTLILRDGGAGTLTAADLTEADFLFD